jgi:predicted metalloprotease with PDZ domain
MSVFQLKRAALVLVAAALPVAATAQTPCGLRVFSQGVGMGAIATRVDGSRTGAAIGLTTSSGATVRDTLGVLVSSVTAGSPAEKAGIEEGNRIASVNGVSLKLATADVGDEQMAGIMSRRLCRELDKVRAGDELDLRVYASGQTKAVKVKAIDSDSLYRSRVSTRLGERATLGISLAVTGSSRDTLGVFVMSVDDGGPAAKAGIEEGNRIAAINGVDVRARRGDEDDWSLRSASLNRLQREIQRVRPGDEVDLRVYSSGQYKNVKVKSASALDFPNRKRSMTIIGPDRVVVPPMDLHDLRVDIDGARIGDEVRRAVEMGLDGAGRGLDVAARALDGVKFGLFNRISW